MYKEGVPMNLEEQYQEISKIKQEINLRLSRGTAASDIRELAIFLAQDRNYQKINTSENQLIKLSHFLTIWQEEKQKLPSLGISEDIFYQVHNLDELEQKHRRIEYYGLRIENNVPEPYCRELMDLLMEQKVSGLALGIIIRNRTERGGHNLLSVARELKQRLDLPNAVLLLQYAREKYPRMEEELLLEEADCWLQGQQFEKAYELLSDLKNPSPEIQELIHDLRHVCKGMKFL